MLDHAKLDRRNEDVEHRASERTTGSHDAFSTNETDKLSLLRHLRRVHDPKGLEILRRLEHKPAPSGDQQ